MKENTLTILQTLESQLSHRLEKLWRVFSWCSSILISITAGVLAAEASQDFQITVSGRISISAVVVIVTIYAWAWIRENLRFEKNVRDQIDSIFAEEINYPQLNALRPDKAKFGYKDVTLLLGLVSLVSTWAEFIIEFS
ncbi:MAG: hypothetical protein IPN08_13875 [Bacteroidales bacterium]|nr:hypothetical protein [Bacteroidales bacterium]